MNHRQPATTETLGTTHVDAFNDARRCFVSDVIKVCSVWAARRGGALHGLDVCMGRRGFKWVNRVQWVSAS